MNADQVWARIVDSAGEEFRQIQGRAFTYEVRGPRTLKLHTTARFVSRASIERALDRWPVAGPGGLQDLNAPSYVYALLADKRILPS